MGYNLTEDEMKEFRRKHNLDPYSSNKQFHSLNRFKIQYPSEQLENTIGFIFFVKPDCYMFEKYSSGNIWNKDITNQSVFHDELNSCPEAFLTLQKDQSGEPFIYPFYRHAKNFQPKDQIIKTRTSGETANDWKTMYGHIKNESNTADTFNMQFSDTRDLIIYKILKTWVNYIDLITKGLISPHHDNRKIRILDYASTVYFFLTSEDGATIIHYEQYKGVFPLNIPDSDFTYEIGNQFKPLEYDIQFQYSIRDTSPGVIRDFMTITSDYNDGSYRPAISDGFMTNTWCDGVYIEEKGDKYMLRFN